MSQLRVFISSPGDVQLERQIARRAVQRLQGEFGEHAIGAYFWEYEPMHLTRDFTTQIPRTSEFDIVVCILWSRLGTPLGEKYTRPDGTTYRSGTEFEFEDAARSFETRGVPNILVYRNISEPLIKARPREERERQLEQLDALDAFLNSWTKNGQVLTGALTTYADASRFEELLTEQLRKLIQRRLGVEPRVPTAATWTSGSPFRGLEVFDFEHAPIFQGRTRATQDVINIVRRQHAASQDWVPETKDRLRPPTFVLISAMSGIGKSSLVRAGVLPLLTAPGVIEGVGLWRHAVIQPPGSGGNLILALASALSIAVPELSADGSTANELTGLLRSNPGCAEALIKGGLSQAASEERMREAAKLDAWEAEMRAQGRATDADQYRVRRNQLQQASGALALVVDQLEEVLAGAAGSNDESELFLAAIATLARSGRVTVLATLRSDFFERIARYPVLLGLTKEGALYQLELPTGPELGRMIRNPARAGGLRFEEDVTTGEQLDDVLLTATLRNPAALPLLEFALDQLYQTRSDDGTLTFSSYRTLGGVEGAIAERAEQEFAALDEKSKSVFGKVCSSLVELAEDFGRERATRRRADINSFVNSATRALIDRFVSARLLVVEQSPGEGTHVSITHEALFSHWDRLKSWIKHHSDLLRARARIEPAAARWSNEGQPRNLLLAPGRLLTEAKELLKHREEVELTPTTLAYIRQSTNSARRRRMAIAAASALLLAGFAGAGVAAYYYRTETALATLEKTRFDYDNAIQDAERMFLTGSLANDAEVEAALAECEHVLHLRDALMRLGHPPDTADGDTVRVLEYEGFLKIVQKDYGEAQRIFDEKTKLEENIPLDRRRSRVRAATDTNLLRAVRLQAEHAIANYHLRALLRQNKLLKEALRERFGETAGSSKISSAPGEAQGTSDESLPANDDDPVPQIKRAEAVFEYLEARYNDSGQNDFGISLPFIQELTADIYQELGDSTAAFAMRRKAITSAVRFLTRLRSRPADDRGEGNDTAAAGRVLEYRWRLADKLYETKDYAGSLAAAQEALSFVEHDPSMGKSLDKFIAHKKIAAALIALGRKSEGLQEIELGAAPLANVGQSNVVESWADLATRYAKIAAARFDAGDVKGSIDAYALAAQAELDKLSSVAGRLTPNERAEYLIGVSWYQLLARQFEQAEKSTETGLALTTDGTTALDLRVNLAESLLFQGQASKAKTIYEGIANAPAGTIKSAWGIQHSRHSGSGLSDPSESAPEQKQVNSGQIEDGIYADIILRDISAFKRIGMTHPDLESMEKYLQAQSDAKHPPRPLIPAARLLPPQPANRAFLGIEYEPVGLKGVEGLKIVSVILGGPAEKAGLKAGDVVAKVGDWGPSEGLSEVAKMEPGRQLALTVWRDGKEFRIDIVLGKHP